jgi:hypothetical protein
VVVRDFNVLGIATPPIKTDPVPVVDPNAMLPLPLATKTLKAIPGRRRQFLQIADSVQLVQLPARNEPETLGAYLSCGASVRPIKYVLRSSIPKSPYHGSYYTLYDGIETNPTGKGTECPYFCCGVFLFYFLVMSNFKCDRFEN